MHTHPEDHISFKRSGRIRWTVEGDSIDAEAGDKIVTSAGVRHAFQVLGGKRSGRPRHLSAHGDLR